MNQTKEKDPADRILWQQSGVNLQGEPFIQVMIDEEVVCQLTVAQAQNHALAVLAVAEAAEQDAFFWTFLRDKLLATETEAAGVLTNYRRFREERGKQGPPSEASKFVVTDKHRKQAGG